MNVVCHHPELQEFVLTGRLGQWAGVRRRLESWGTLDLQPDSHGLFAAVADGGRNRLSGYQSVWLRDNVHVAHALWRSGDQTAARRTLDSLLDYQLRHAHRFRDVATGHADPADPMQRPQVRFRSGTLAEIDQPWAHAQNDAVGYVLWLAARMWRETSWRPSHETLGLFALQVAYLRALPYHQDRDSGHWEEERALKSSSVGTMVAALESLAEALDHAGLGAVEDQGIREDVVSISELAVRGRNVLESRLPFETPGVREADAALLFLIEPLAVLDPDQTDAVLDDVRRDLMASHGFKRYRGDSYWCAGYRELVAAERRSADYAESTAERDRLLQPGEEAQWCIFDPILSIHHGRRHRRMGDPTDRELELLHLRRALGQITGPDEWCDAGLCPEAYFLESRLEGRYRPNDQTPLAWTQANLRWAMAEFEKGL